MSITAYLKNKILDHVLNVAIYSQPAGFWVSLHTGDPTEESGPYEISASGTGYTRQAIDFFAASGGDAWNDDDITFPTALTDWGTITYVGIYDWVTPGIGNLLYYMELGDAQTVSTGDDFIFYTHDIVLSLNMFTKDGIDFNDQILRHFTNLYYPYTPTPLYLSLYDSADSESAGNLMYNAYERQSIAFGAAVDGVSLNVNEITFPIVDFISSKPGALTYFGLENSTPVSTPSDYSTRIFRGSLTKVKSITVNDLLKFDIGSITVTVA